MVSESAVAAMMQGMWPGGQQQQQQALRLALRVRRGHILEDALTQIRGSGPQVGKWKLSFDISLYQPHQCMTLSVSTCVHGSLCIQKVGNAVPTNAVQWWSQC